MIFAFAFLFIIFVLMASSTSSLAEGRLISGWHQRANVVSRNSWLIGLDLNIFKDTFWLNSCRTVDTMVTTALQTTDKIEAKHKKEEDEVMRSDGAW